MEELADFEEEIKKAENIESLAKDEAFFRQIKEFGYSDVQIAYLLNASEEDVAKAEKTIGLKPIYSIVDTCAGEFSAKTPYYYSTYGEYDEPVRKSEKKSIMILGGGPNHIGQGIEFDYCCVHAAFALKEEGYESIMVNSNPETVSTDYDISDKLYFEPLTLENVMNIYEREHCSGVIVQFGGQTPLNLASKLKKAGANVIGTSPRDIELAEDRDFFKTLATKLGINQPKSGIAHTVEDALKVASEIGYPVLVRPSFVLGGRGMVIAYNAAHLKKYTEDAVQVSGGKPILIDRFLEDAIETDVDCISDGKTTVVGAIMEHVEPAGIHSGDSACFIPPATLSAEVMDTMRRHAYDLARSLHVCGLMNIQFAVQKGKVYIIEVNPRASRTIPFVSKSIGVPLAMLASRCMLGRSLEELNFTQEVKAPYTAVKEAVFPFIKFPGADVDLNPEMHSTGEVMSVDLSRGLAYLKSQLAAGNELPESGAVFLSVKDADKKIAAELAKELSDMGFTIYATKGTSTMLYNNGIKTEAVFRISGGRPNLLDLLDENRIQWVITTAEGGEDAKRDELQMRSSAIMRGVPTTSTISGMVSALAGIKEKRDFGRLEVCSLQEYHRHRKVGGEK